MLNHHPHSRLSLRERTCAGLRSGLTLVEMMVSVALTLFVVFALVQVFQLLGGNVTDGRATIEMSGNLRTAANLLREDLDGLTVTTVPPRSPSQNEGYFEVFDGLQSDSRHFLVNGQPTIVDANAQKDGFLDPAGVVIDTSVGDVDDVMCFTTRRADRPFTGMITDPRILLPNNLTDAQLASASAAQLAQLQYVSAQAPTYLQEANEAEVVWWTQHDLNTVFDPSAPVTDQIALAATALTTPPAINDLHPKYPNGPNGATPVRSLHRRVLLIRPDLDLRLVQMQSQTEIQVFLNANDISVRFVRVSGNTGGSYFQAIPNSLGDLTERHNRAYRNTVQVGVGFVPYPNGAAPSAGYIDYSPKSDPLVPGFSTLKASLLAQNGILKDLGGNNAAWPANTTANPQLLLLRKGKDIVLSDVLGFDVKVWDPEAPVLLSNDGQTVMTPSDPAYFLLAGSSTPPPNTLAGRSKGAYVDLGYAEKHLGLQPALSSGLFGNSHFALLGRIHPDPRYPRLPTYCTWSSKYEYDGHDQDKDAPNPFIDASGNSIVDQGTNGLDDVDPNLTQKVAGVDDASEAETSPPYPHNLSGLKVSMRIMEPATRQVRQSDVIHDFVFE